MSFVEIIIVFHIHAVIEYMNTLRWYALLWTNQYIGHKIIIESWQYVKCVCLFV